MHDERTPKTQSNQSHDITKSVYNPKFLKYILKNGVCRGIHCSENFEKLSAFESDFLFL